MAEVFISYSQKDREAVVPIASRLADLGVDVWFDRELSAGERFSQVIREKLREARAAVVCWSPNAVASEWVDAEADFARELGTYVPIKISPCALEPPFNRIHTEDFSNSSLAAADPNWLKLVDRVAKLIGRDGVAAAAKAYAAGEDRTLYDFAKRYPDEPAARRVWTNAEIRHRREFENRLQDARSAADEWAARTAAEAADLADRIDATVPAFEAWLAEERRGAAGPAPDPRALVERRLPAEEKKLRDQIAALSRALAHRKETEEDLHAAKSEVVRLSGQLATALAELRRLEKENAALSDVVAEENKFTVVLAAIGEKKISVIKEIRAITRLGLKEAKDLVEGAPTPVQEGLAKEDAVRIKVVLESVGAQVELRRGRPRVPGGG